MNYLQYRGTDQDAGLDIGRILRRKLGLSETKIRSVRYDPAGILLNGVRSRTNAVVQPGDLLQVKLKDSSLRQDRLEPYEAELKILYEDADLIIVNKPSGMVCHPSRGHYSDTLVNALRTLYRQRGEDARVHLIGRLDKDTSGVVAAAKHQVAAERIRQQMEGTLWLEKQNEDAAKQAPGFEKVYLALVKGTFSEKEGVIRTPLKRCEDPRTGLVYMEAADDGDLAAETRWRVMERKSMKSGSAAAERTETVEEIRPAETVTDRSEGTILEVRIMHGRMHQIRCHMASIGHPLLGDPIYGGHASGKFCAWNQPRPAGDDGGNSRQAGGVGSNSQPAEGAGAESGQAGGDRGNSRQAGGAGGNSGQAEGVGGNSRQPEGAGAESGQAAECGRPHISHTMLHCWKLTMKHPFTDEWIRAEAEPDDLFAP